MRTLLTFLLTAALLVSAPMLAQMSQQPTRSVYVFAPPKSGGTSADLQITVQIAASSNALVWCNGSNCGGAGPVNTSFNPQFSTAWSSLPVLINGVSHTISSCASATACTTAASFSGAACATSCTMRITNMLLNTLNNRLLQGAGASIFSGVANFVNWADVDMSGSINVTNASTTIAFNTIFQHCTNTSSCGATTFACSSAWNGKTFKVFDSAAAAVRTVTLTDCTHLSATYTGTTNAAQLFFGLYDYTIPDAMITTYAINGKKVALIVRPAESSNINIETPAYATGTDFANSQVQTNISTGCNATTTVSSNLITFSGCNEINWAGTISITGVTALVIDHCIPNGLWSYTTTNCYAQTNASASVAGAAFTWTPSAINVCFATAYPGGMAGTVINGITYGSVLTNACGNGQLGAAPLRTSQNPTGINAYYSFVYQQAWQPFFKDLLNHYSANGNVAYVRVGGTAGGEWFPFAQTVMSGIVPSATVSDPAWTRYLYAANNDSQNAAIQSLGLPASFMVESSANNCTGAGNASDWSCADLVFSDALFRGLNGFGSQGLSFSDIKFYSGFPCSGNHCRWWDYINSCQPSAPYTGCNANIVTPFLLEVQQAGASDLYNTFFGTGVANAAVSAVRSKGKVTVTFTTDPTSGVKTDGSSAITMINWDSSFNGTYQIVNSSAGSKTLTYLQPNLSDATSVAVGAAGNSVFGSWSLTLPFEYARGTNDVELYFDDAATLNPDPQDTYHSAIANGTYMNGVTLGTLWNKVFSDFVANAIR